ncbi:MAG: hypothetical protein B7Z72_14840, partial [Gemmatimonadetes bacterium 21-71-4]
GDLALPALVAGGAGVPADERMPRCHSRHARPVLIAESGDGRPVHQPPALKLSGGHRSGPREQRLFDELSERVAARVDELIAAKHFLPGKVSVSTAHLMGGCAMGAAGDRSSVTDAWGRVHGMPWLRVADSSLFPDSLEINPYLTIMALADRVAEGIRGEARDLLGIAATEGTA